MRRERLNITTVRILAGMCLAWAAGSCGFAAEPPRGLVLHFNFNQADAGGFIADGSGQKNNGKVTGAKWTSSGKVGGGSELAPTNGCIRVANSPSLNLKQATFSVWFKTGKSDAVWRRILNKGTDGAFALSIAGDSKDPQAKGKLSFRIGDRYECLSDNTVADGLWHHAAATFDGKELRLYVDGQAQKQVIPCSGASIPSMGELTVGIGPASPQKSQSLDGSVDDVMVFNRPLAADEIKAMVTAVDPAPGKPKFTKQQVAGRLRQLKLLFEEGLLTEEFYEERVKECEAAQ